MFYVLIIKYNNITYLIIYRKTTSLVMISPDNVFDLKFFITKPKAIDNISLYKLILFTYMPLMYNKTSIIWTIYCTSRYYFN